MYAYVCMYVCMCIYLCMYLYVSYIKLTNILSQLIATDFVVKVQDECQLYKPYKTVNITNLTSIKQ